MESVLSFSHIQFLHSIRYTTAGGCGPDPKGSSGGCALDGDARLDVSAGETALGVTAAGT